jgi:hypothetical protein
MANVYCWLATPLASRRSGICAAACISALAVLASSDASAVNVMTPFAWPRLVLIHVVCCLPLAVQCSRSICPQSTLPRRSVTLFWIGLTAIASWTVGFGGNALATIAIGEPAFLVRHAWRVATVLALQVPVLAAVTTLAPRPADLPTSAGAAQGLTLGILLAWFVPHSYLSVYLPQQTRHAESIWQQSRLSEAQVVLLRLCDVGSGVSVAVPWTPLSVQKPSHVEPRQARTQVDAQLAACWTQIHAIRTAPATPAARFQLGRLLIAVGEWPAAHNALTEAAQSIPEAASTLAQLHHIAGDLEGSVFWAKRALLSLSSSSETRRRTSSFNDELLSAYFAAAMFAGESGDLRRAESYLCEALERVPGRSAAVHEQLARHYEFVGDIAEAREHRRAAAVLDGNGYEPLESFLFQVLSNGAPIGLSRPGASQYR